MAWKYWYEVVEGIIQTANYLKEIIIRENNKKIEKKQF